MKRFTRWFSTILIFSFVYPFSAFANYNLKCTATNFSKTGTGEVTYHNIYTDITETKDQVNFDGKIFITIFDETFTLVAHRKDRRIVLDKLEGVIFLEKKIKNKFVILEIFHCIGLKQQKV